MVPSSKTEVGETARVMLGKSSLVIVPTATPVAPSAGEKEETIGVVVSAIVWKS